MIAAQQFRKPQSKRNHQQAKLKMSIRVHRSVSRGILRLFVTRSGPGISVGIPGFRVSRNWSGQFYLTVGFKGSGVYWRQRLFKKKGLTSDTG